MAFIDEMKIYMKAGDGGNGVERWRHEKGKSYGGPAGGDGGKGGDVIVRAIRDVQVLAKYRHQKEFIAEHGVDGGSNSLHGKNGEDLILNVPIGTIVRNLRTDETVSLLMEGEQALLLKGGRGGYGNEYFKSSTNRSPKECVPGAKGQDAEFELELQLVADIGFVGLPNAGKSSLLNTLTRASAKTADYPFTTLEPNLGECFGFVLADIPGLIEGASRGRGLGYKFLRHVKRTKMLAHLVSLENEDPVSAYKIVRNELSAYDNELAKKKEIIILTKTDMVTSAQAKKALTVMKKANPKAVAVFAISVLDDAVMKSFQDELLKLLKTEQMS
jgi:GTP-binding protein